MDAVVGTYCISGREGFDDRLPLVTRRRPAKSLFFFLISRPMLNGSRYLHAETLPLAAERSLGMVDQNFQQHAGGSGG